MREIIKADNTNIAGAVRNAIRLYGDNADLNHIDVSEVTIMCALFIKSEFNGDISKWDVSNVTEMDWMFYDSKFNGDLSNWNVSNLISARYMFYQSDITGDLSNWNVCKLKDGMAMFSQTKISFDFNKWTTVINTKKAIWFIASGSGYTGKLIGRKGELDTVILIDGIRGSEEELLEYNLKLLNI
jgi:surface protein